MEGKRLSLKLVIGSSGATYPTRKVSHCETCLGSLFLFRII